MTTPKPPKPKRRKMKNKEQIYDSEINPLMAKIISICQRDKIAMVASFDIPNDDDKNLVVTTHLPDETGNLPERIQNAANHLKRSHYISPFMIIG